MKCNNCGTINLADALRCTECNVILKGSMIAPVRKKYNIAHNELMCKNCGQINKPGTLKCTNCNASLDGSMVIASKTPTSEMVASTYKAEDFQERSSSKEVQQSQKSKTWICADCQYPNLADAISCVQCGKKINTSSTTALSTHEMTEDSGMKTINPWLSHKKTAFSLEAITQGDIQGETLNFEGQHIKLKRNNLDPDNKTISASLQSSIYYENGHWYINDESTQKTSFIRIKPKTRLASGDILLFGNKLFVFKAE